MSAELPEVIQKYLAAYNARDVDSLLATITDDVVFENLTNQGEATRTEGRAAFEALARQSAKAFASRRQSVVELVVGGDRVALLVDYEATIATDLPNGWKAGQTIRLRGSSFFRLRDGLIARVIDLS
jgi:steroid delta-isomerase-like uncharacterized protein